MSFIKCPKCGSKNRTKEDHPGVPVCGKCKTPLTAENLAQPIELSDDEFDPFVQNSKYPVLVDFWASWCGPCRVMGPVVEEFAQKHINIKVAKFNTENNFVISARYSVSSIPTLILFVAGKETKRIVGSMSLSGLESELKAWL